MSSTDSLNVLRERNKDLLMQLRHQTEELKKLRRSMAGTTNSEETAQSSVQSEPGSKLENGSTTVNGTQQPWVQNEEKRKPVEIMVTLINADRGPARAALRKPAVRFSEIVASAPSNTDDDTVECTPAVNRRKTSTPFHLMESSLVGGQPMYTGLVNDKGNLRPTEHVESQESRKPATQPVVCNREKQQKEMGGVTLQSLGQEQSTVSDRQRLQPLLGYDWIAGLLDADTSIMDRSEEFFSDLRTFRQVNRDECVHSQYVGQPEEDTTPTHWLEEDERTQPTMEPHHCTFCYRINSRLFPTPLDPEEACPVCRMPKAEHPHSSAEPAFIRVSIPRSTLLPAYQYKPHRRRSFDPSDSLGLPSHCLSGWSNPAPSSVVPASSLDLRSSLCIAPPAGLESTQPIDLQQGLSVSRVSGGTRSDQLLNASRLVRYRFQKFPPNGKRSGSSYPVF